MADNCGSGAAGRRLPLNGAREAITVTSGLSLHALLMFFGQRREVQRT
jgi:hypothetical protein